MLAYPTIYCQRYVTFKGKALINKYFKVTTVSFQHLASFCLINIIILPIKKDTVRQAETQIKKNQEID